MVKDLAGEPRSSGSGGRWKTGGAFAPQNPIVGVDADYVYQADTGTVTAEPTLIEILGVEADYVYEADTGTSVYDGIISAPAAIVLPSAVTVTLFSSRSIS